MDTEIAPHIIKADSLYLQAEEELTRSYSLDYSTPEWDGYSLYSCVWLIQDPYADRSFLGWDRSEKAQATEEWLGYITKLLLSFGYKLDGTVIAQGERDNDRWTFFTHNGKYLRTQGHLTPTWEEEFKQAVSDSETAAGGLPF